MKRMTAGFAIAVIAALGLEASVAQPAANQPPAKLAQGSAEQLIKCENAYYRTYGATSGPAPYVEAESPRRKAAWIARNQIANRAANDPPGGKKAKRIQFLSPQEGTREPAALHAEVVACDNALGFNIATLSPVEPLPSNADQGARPTGALTPLLQLGECSKVYRSLNDNFNAYFSQDPYSVSVSPPTRAFQDVQKVISDRVDALGVRQPEWSSVVRMDTFKGPVFMADVISRTKACDAYLKVSIAPLLPPLWQKPKPAIDLVSANPAMMDCAKLTATHAAMRGEIDFIRSERIRLGDGLVQSRVMSQAQFDDLLQAVAFKAKSLNCPNSKDLEIHVLQMSSMAQFPLKQPRTTPIGTDQPAPGKMAAVVAATGKPGEYDQLVSCQRTYMVAAHGDHYLGAARRAPNLAQPVNDVTGKLFQRAMKLNPDQGAWMKAAYAQTQASPLVYANIHDKVKACDMALGYNIRPLMPPPPVLANKPATGLSTYNLARVKALDCAGLQTFYKVWQDEVVYVRSERIRAGDAAIRSKQVTFGQISDMGHAAEKRGNELKCGFGAGLSATMAAAFDFAQKLP